MDLRPTESELELRAEATGFCDRVRPGLEQDAEWWQQGMPSDGDSKELTRELGRSGWIGMTWPQELGGRGLSHVDAAIVEEVFGYHWLPLSLYLLSYKTVGCALERFGSPELKERLLPQIAKGELTFCQGFSEPGAGSDLAALTTRAVRRRERFVVHGHKIWTSSAWLADWIYLAVRTHSRRPRHRGISVLVAPLDSPGIEVRRFPVLGGGVLCEVFLDGVEIDAANLVGELNGGWDVLMHTLDFERVTTDRLGGLTLLLEGLERRLSETNRLGGVWERVALLRGELEAARLLAFRAADLLDKGEPASAASAMAQLSAARLTQRFAREAVELLGLEGLADGDPSVALHGRAAALYRASVGSTISGGSAEIMQLVIARRGLGLP